MYLTEVEMHHTAETQLIGGGGMAQCQNENGKTVWCQKVTKEISNMPVMMGAFVF